MLRLVVQTKRKYEKRVKKSTERKRNEGAIGREKRHGDQESADSVRVVDDARRAAEHVKRIAEVCADEVGRRK